MRPQAYDKYIFLLTMPALLVSVWFGLTMGSLMAFPGMRPQLNFEVIAPVVNPLVAFSFLTSPTAIYLFGRSSTKRFAATCFIFNGLYMLVWIFGAVAFYILWSVHHPFANS